ncbi:MAG: aspartate--tRNA(Asn) ligase [Candidatus Paceibacterota bacterium]
MSRILIKETIEKVGEEVLVQGWVLTRRDLGKLVFLDLGDRTGSLQVVCELKNMALPEGIKEQWVLQIKGKIAKRPEKLVNKDSITGGIEMQASEIVVLAKSEILPFELKNIKEVSMPVVLDHRPFSLRAPELKAIFKVQEKLIDGFREHLKANDFTEFQASGLVGVATEGGSEVFHVDYYDYDAYLAQSPQFHKQMLVGVYERVLTVTKAYRAEPHATSRHLSEYVSLDAEMGFINSWEDIMVMCEGTLKAMMGKALQEVDACKIYNVEPLDLSRPIPRIKLREAQKLLGVSTDEPDLAPEDERKICEWAKKEYGSDFIFITHFPTKKRPFYTYPDPQDPEYTLGFDLLFKGLEIVTGGQRINDYEQLLANIKKWGNKPEDFEMYLEAFKYGMPPEGGFAIGIERVTKQFLGLDNVANASLFPRDMERIDIRLSTVQERKTKKQ